MVNATRAARPGLPSAVCRGLRQSIAPFLILVTPFAIFVRFHQYGFASAELLLLLLALAALALLVGVGARWSSRFEVVALAALLTWFADVQLQDPGAKRLVLLFLVLCALMWALRDHAARIVSLMMATILATSLLPPQGRLAATPLPGRVRASAAAARPQRASKPLIVHLIFDEHIGPEGFPADVAPRSFKDDTRSFFVDRGFKVFGGAYSEHPWTLESLSHLLNLVPGRYQAGLVAAGRTGATNHLTRNAYFERLEAEGYRIRAFHPDYLDACAGRVAPPACHAYGVTSLRALHDLPVSAREKALFIAGSLLDRSEAVGRLNRLYRRVRRQPFAQSIHLPDWPSDRHIVSPVATMRVVDAMVEDLARSEPGDLFFSHLLLPHYPYVYDTDCRPRPPSEWRQRADRDDIESGEGATNTPGSRAARYALYVQQIRCVQRTIDRLLGAIPSSLRHDAIVVVQGDHGSRIGLVEPISSRERVFSPADYADFFSTLFAVRSSRLDPGYESEPTSIVCLLRSLVGSDFTSTTGANACSSARVVFFKDRMPHVLPDFPRGDAPAAIVTSATQ